MYAIPVCCVCLVHGAYRRVHGAATRTHLMYPTSHAGYNMLNAHILWMKMGIFCCCFFLSWATLRSVVRLCFTSARSVINATALFNDSTDPLMVDDVMVQHFMLVFFYWTRNIFQYQYSACAAVVVVVVVAAPIPIFGSIYRRAKCAKCCKLISVLLWLFIQFTSVLLHFKWFTEIELQRNTFHR